MRFGSRDRHRSARALGVVVMTLSLVHTPLPLPDYHNVRHHDGPGEVCEHHDHLLRWHPGAALASDVAVLHWHWFLPTSSDDPYPEGSGLSIHAHLHDWSASPWEDGPQVATRGCARPDLSPRLAVSPPGASAVFLPFNAFGALPTAGPSVRSSRSAPVARGASLVALLHRWVC
jgi:hypothetical protein